MCTSRHVFQCVIATKISRKPQSVPSAGKPQDVNLGLDDTEDTTPSACRENSGSAGGRLPQGDRWLRLEAALSLLLSFSTVWRTP